MARKPFHQGAGTGLCGPFALINALSLLFPRRVNAESQETIVGVLVDAYPGNAAELLKEGAERAEVEAMLNGLRAWTEAQMWPSWGHLPMHPIEGESSAEFWEAIAVELELPYTAAVIGFGEASRPGTRYVPHYTCVSRVTDAFLSLSDSDEYKRVPRKHTGIRPEPGWAIEDGWVLSRA